MLKEAWTERRGFGHRIGGPILEGSLDDQVFSVLALLDAYETTLDPRYFSAAQKTIDLAISRYGDAEGGGFFDRPSDAAPMGGLDVRRKPFQDSPTPGANSVAAIALIRMHAFTGDDRYRAFAYFDRPPCRAASMLCLGFNETNTQCAMLMHRALLFPHFLYVLYFFYLIISWVSTPAAPSRWPGNTPPGCRSVLQSVRTTRKPSRTAGPSGARRHSPPHSGPCRPLL